LTLLVGRQKGHPASKKIVVVVQGDHRTKFHGIDEVNKELALTRFMFSP